MQSKNYFFIIAVIYLSVNILMADDIQVQRVWNPQQKIYSEVISNEIIVQYKNSASARAKKYFAPELKNAVKKTELSGLILYKINDGRNLFDVISALLQNPDVKWAQPNYAYKIFRTIPNDPDFGDKQWYLNYTGIPDMWDNVKGDNSNIIIAVLDTGIDTLHPDLQGRIYENAAEINGLEGIDDDANGYIDDKYGFDAVFSEQVSDNGTSDNFYDDIMKNTQAPKDWNGHGTAVASVIGAKTNNRIGISGILWGGKILNVRVGNSDATMTTIDIIKGVVYAVRAGASVINMSFGGYSNDNLEEKAINEAYNRGVVLIASAGNESYNYAAYPAQYGNVISVGAIQMDGTKSSFSNYGYRVDLMAPGSAIYAALRNTSNYDYFDGTSFSAPIVSGCAGLLLVYNSSLKPWEIREILKAGCKPMGSDYGAGNLNIMNSFRQFSEYGKSASSIQNKKVISFPNPFKYGKDAYLTFKALSNTSKISLKIYTVSGKLIKEINFNSQEVSDYDNDGSAEIRWNGLDKDGKICSPGSYFFISTIDNGIDWGKFTIISW